MIALVGFITVQIQAQSIKAKSPLIKDSDSNFSYVNDMLLESSRHTQYAPTTQEQLATYEDHKLTYTDEELELMGFSKLLTHDNSSELWFEQRSFSVIIKDKFGYMWSSRGENQAVQNSTAITKRRVLSGINIQYINKDSVKPGAVTALPILDVLGANFRSFDNENPAEDDDLYNDKIRPYIISRVQTDRVSVTYNVKDGKVISTVHYKKDREGRINIDVKFNVEMTLTDSGFEVLIPEESIVEDDLKNRLLSINLFPYLGSTLTDTAPGYAVVPEGVGALIRFNKLQTELMTASYYTNDIGYGTNKTGPVLGLPFYGIVHAEGNHAMYAYLKQGTENSSLQVKLYEGTTYNSVSNTFNVRTLFSRPINRVGTVVDAVLDERYPASYQLEYRFLSEENADYVGIAKDYRDQLIKDEVLRKEALQSDISILLSYIMSDQENAFLGTKKVSMTTTKDIESIYEYFKTQGITNQQSILRGWSNDGFVDRAPYRLSTVESAKNFNKLSKLFADDGNDLLIDNDYVQTTSLSKRGSKDNDTIKTLGRIRWEIKDREDGFNTYILKPQSSLTMAKNDVNKINNLGIKGLYSASLGHLLFSHYDKKQNVDQMDALNAYQEILKLYEVNYVERANANLFEYITAYTGLPTTNAQLTIYSDLVPLVPIVLKGSMAYYGGDLNFNALGIERLLQMVDFGVSPSYILTMEDTYKMRFTRANKYFSTTYSNYQEDIIDTYNFLNDALKHTQGAYFEKREMLASGVVKNTYKKDHATVVIYVNYTQDVQTFEGITIAARHYEVVA